MHGRAGRLYALDNAWGRHGWTRATLAALSEAELWAALEMAWRHGAARKKTRKVVTAITADRVFRSTTATIRGLDALRNAR